MASVDLTRIFLQLRSNCGSTNLNFHDEDDQATLLPNQHGQTNSSPTSAPSPVWTTGIDYIKTTLQNSNKFLNHLKSHHESVLSKPMSFDHHFEQNNSTNSETVEQIARTSEEITNGIRMVERKLKSFNKWKIENKHKISQREFIIMENISSCLAEQLQTLTSSFSKQQNHYTEKMQRKHAKSGVKSVSTNNNLLNEIVSHDESTLEQVQQTLQLNEEINDREQSINDVTKDIYELNRLFKEVCTMVVEQGSVLDRIDYNIELTADRVEQGHEELQKARTHQKKNKKLYIIICEAVFVIFLFLVFILRHF